MDARAPGQRLNVIRHSICEFSRMPISAGASIFDVGPPTLGARSAG
jgi:hypothetical protein